MVRFCPTRFVAMCCLVLGCNSPSHITDSQATQSQGPDLPPRADKWTSVGRFVLQDGESPVEVRVYDATSFYTYPCIPSLHLFYKAGKQSWKEAEPYTGSRFVFVGVGSVNAESVELTFRPQGKVLAAGEPIPEQKPTFIRKLVLKNGVPAVSDE